MKQNTLLLKLRAQHLIVVDLTVIDNGKTGIGANHWLSAAPYVNNAQTGMPERHTTP